MQGDTLLGIVSLRDLFSAGTHRPSAPRLGALVARTSRRQLGAAVAWGHLWGGRLLLGHRFGCRYLGWVVSCGFLRCGFLGGRLLGC
jgi:hypothetical protein